MFEEESLWLKNVIHHKVDLHRIETVLDVGSSTLHARTIAQPFVDANIFKPLRDEDKEIVHLDMIEGQGVDVCCNLDDVKELARKFDVVIAANLLEHVIDPVKIITDLISLLNWGGYLLVTVPHVLVYHEEPIDTMYRPSNREIEELASGLTVIDSKIIRINSVRLKRRLSGLNYFLKNMLTRKRDILNELALLFRRFKVSCVAFKYE